MKIAAFQRFPIYDDVDRICDVVVRDLRWAQAQGIGLALFPEAFLLGHSYDAGVIAERARRVSGGALDSLRHATAPFDPICIIGAFEVRGAAIANSAIILSRGQEIGRYAKAHPNEPGVAAGTTFPVFDHRGLRFGIGICNDANYPETAERLAGRGAALILYPLSNMLAVATADRWRAKSIANLQARATQTGCWIASADVTGSQDDKLSHGCTAIVSPDGAIVARVDEDREGVAVFDLGERAGSPATDTADRSGDDHETNP